MARKVDFGAERDLFRVSLTSVIGGTFGGVSTSGTILAPGMGGAVVVVLGLPQTSQRASSRGGERRGAEVVVDDVVIGESIIGGAASTSEDVDRRGGCSYGVVLAGV